MAGQVGLLALAGIVAGIVVVAWLICFVIEARLPKTAPFTSNQHSQCSFCGKHQVSGREDCPNCGAAYNE